MFFFSHVAGKPTNPRQPDVRFSHFWSGVESHFWFDEEKGKEYLDPSSTTAWLGPNAPMIAGVNNPYRLGWTVNDLAALMSGCASQLSQLEGAFSQERSVMCTAASMLWDDVIQNQALEPIETFIWIKKQTATLLDPGEGFSPSNIRIHDTESRFFHIKLWDSEQLFVFRIDNWTRGFQVRLLANFRSSDD